MSVKITQKDRLLSVSLGWDGLMVHLRTPNAEIAIVLNDYDAETLRMAINDMLDDREET